MIAMRTINVWPTSCAESRLLLFHDGGSTPSREPSMESQRPKVEMGHERDSSVYDAIPESTDVAPATFMSDEEWKIAHSLEALRATSPQEDRLLAEGIPLEAPEAHEIERSIDILENALNLEPDSALSASYASGRQEMPGSPTDDVRASMQADKEQENRAQVARTEQLDACEKESTGTLAMKLRAEALADIKEQMKDLEAARNKESAWQPTTSWLRPLKRDGEHRAHRARLDALAKAQRVLDEQALILQGANDTNEPQNLRHIIDARTAIGLPPSTVSEQFATAFERSRWQAPLPMQTALRGVQGGEKVLQATVRPREQRSSAVEALPHMPEGIARVPQPAQETMLTQDGWQPVDASTHTFEKNGIQIAYDEKTRGYTVREGNGEWRTTTNVRYGPAEDRSPALNRIAEDVSVMNERLRDPWQTVLRSLPKKLQAVAAVQADTILQRKGFRYDAPRGAFVNDTGEEIQITRDGTWKTHAAEGSETYRLVRDVLAKDIDDARRHRQWTDHNVTERQSKEMLSAHPTWQQKLPTLIVTDTGQELHIVSPYGWCLFDPETHRWYDDTSAAHAGMRELIATLRQPWSPRRSVA